MLDRDLIEFFEHTADAAFTVSDSGEICSWNASAERLFGFQRAEAIGKTCSELFQGRDVLGALVCTDHCHLRDCASLGTLVPDFDLEVTGRSGGRRSSRTMSSRWRRSIGHGGEQRGSAPGVPRPASCG